jgi:hypothetical protein
LTIHVCVLDRPPTRAARRALSCAITRLPRSNGAAVRPAQGNALGCEARVAPFRPNGPTVHLEFAENCRSVGPERYWKTASFPRALPWAGGMHAPLERNKNGTRNSVIPRNCWHFNLSRFAPGFRPRKLGEPDVTTRGPKMPFSAGKRRNRPSRPPRKPRFAAVGPW